MVYEWLSYGQLKFRPPSWSLFQPPFWISIDLIYYFFTIFSCILLKFRVIANKVVERHHGHLFLQFFYGFCLNFAKNTNHWVIKILIPLNFVTWQTHIIYNCPYNIHDIKDISDGSPLRRLRSLTGSNGR